jgi:hypothetical protein
LDAPGPTLIWAELEPLLLIASLLVMLGRFFLVRWYLVRSNQFLSPQRMYVSWQTNAAPVFDEADQVIISNDTSV